MSTAFNVPLLLLPCTCTCSPLVSAEAFERVGPSCTVVLLPIA